MDPKAEELALAVRDGDHIRLVERRTCEIFGQRVAQVPLGVMTPPRNWATPIACVGGSGSLPPE